MPGAAASTVEPIAALHVDARLVAQLVAIDPAFCGGVVVKASAGPVRDRWLADLRAMLDPSRAWRVVPVHIDDDRLLGGIDLAATLQLGKPVAQRGLLAEADGGVVVLSMAERVASATAAHLAAAIDSGVVRCARDGIVTRACAAFGIVALDESIEGDETISEALRDRMAFQVDLREISMRDVAAWPTLPDRDTIASARSRLTDVTVGDDVVDALCAAALTLGVWSIRASVHVVRAARLLAALTGRLEVGEGDAAAAARLVLSARATRSPPPTEPAEDEHGDSDSPVEPPGHDTPEQAVSPADGDADEPPNLEEATADGASESLQDRVIEAAVAAIPAGLLGRLAAADAGGPSRGPAGRAGAVHASRRGRPAGVRRERPRAGARLDVIATLRAAVPWQRLRGRVAPSDEGQGEMPRTPLRIRAEDFHVGHFKQRGRTTTIFAVDASGSSALNRLAEAKGAVELLLADCYVRRDSVAVVGFRGRAAELLLAPTRSLVRAKRSLAELPGGGGTPLAAGLDAAATLASAVRRRGDSAVVVILSDGRANVARDGGSGRPRAEADARLAARSLREGAASAIFVDTSTQPQPLARELAALMGARYVFLPHAEAATLSAAVRHAAPSRPATR